MGLSKVILCDEQEIELTDKEQQEIDMAWGVLCKNGSVCITDSSKRVERIKDILKKDPNAFIGAGCDYNGDIPYSEFVKRVMAGEYDEK